MDMFGYMDSVIRIKLLLRKNKVTGSFLMLFLSPYL